MNILKRSFFRLKNWGLKKVVLHYLLDIYNILCSIIIRFAKIFPLHNTIVLECESDMDDNPRAIYEYMLKQKKYHKYRFVWIVKNVEFCKENYANPRTVFLNRLDDSPLNRLRLDYYFSTSKYFIFSHPYWFEKKRKNQLVINITHGTPFKKHQDPNTNISETFDLVLCASAYTKNWFLKFLNCPQEKSFICPHPRNDLLYVQNKHTILSQFFDYKKSDKIIICMPTYKQSSDRIDCDFVDEYSLSVITTDDEFKQLNAFLKEKNIHIIVKLHPLQLTTKLKITEATNIHYIQNNELFEKKILLYNLIGCCDAMITDFSSVLFDFILLNRPIAFFTTFFEKYDRGYIMDNPTDYLCGEQINNFEDMICFLKNILDDNDVFYEKRNQINNIINESLSKNCCETFTSMFFN